MNTLILCVIVAYGLLAFGAFLAGLSRISDWREFRRRRRRDERREPYVPRCDAPRREPYVPRYDAPRRYPRTPVRLSDGAFHDDALPGGVLPGRAFLPAPRTLPEPASLLLKRRGTAPFIQRRATPE